MKALPSIALIAALAGCSQADQTKENSEIVHNQVGRFSFIPAGEGYPPMVIDTAAGCVMYLEKTEGGIVRIEEASFAEGTSSCNASKQLLVADTLKRVMKP